MRTISTVSLILFLAFAPAGASAQTSGDETIVSAAAIPADASIEGQLIPVAMEDMDKDDTAIRWMYIGMGGMTAFLLATMPITVPALVATAAAGVAASWAYDYYMAP